jgi:hypothetical protein
MVVGFNLQVVVFLHLVTFCLLIVSKKTDVSHQGCVQCFSHQLIVETVWGLNLLLNMTLPVCVCVDEEWMVAIIFVKVVFLLLVISYLKKVS